jgi:hypothetical protein
MKWLLICVCIGAGVGLFFHFYGHQSEAYKTYLRFDDARRTGNCGALQALTDGEAKTWAANYCAGGNGGDALAGMAAIADGGPDSAYQQAVSAGGLATLQDAAGIIFAHRSVSEITNNDGSVTIVAECFPIDSHNDAANRKFMPSSRLHTLVLKPQGDGFIVLKFSDGPDKS